MVGAHAKYNSSEENVTHLYRWRAPSRIIRTRKFTRYTSGYYRNSEHYFIMYH
ncbi:hypothetical protein SAMN05216583_14325 [Selenomonas sp. KH1T6]|nr:hypothetical protein SAMN05216583_14325 [Selenomonas ruminantium]